MTVKFNTVIHTIIVDKFQMICYYDNILIERRKQ
jgi:hypothetical protein